MRKTKIVGTIGPASFDKGTLRQLFLAGVNVIRMNFSHGTYDEHVKQYEMVQSLNEELGFYVGTLLDTRGPEIRTHLFHEGRAFIKQGSTVTISMKEKLGDENSFSVTYDKLYDDLEVGHLILVDDGYLQLLVIEKDEKNKELITLAKNSHILRDRRGINVPSAKLKLPFISEQDLKDIEFACKYNVDYLAASFVRRKEDVLEIKEILKKANREYIIVIAKIESQEGINNIDEILEVADGIMVARGDLGVEVFPEDLPHVQKEIVLKSQQQGKVCIVATQMLESMIHNPRPTRAEVTDVANAVYEGADATMLSGEMAVGKYPIESVEYMAKIGNRSQGYIDHANFIKNTPVAPDDILEAIAYAAAQTTLHYPVKAILSYGHSQSKTISKYRPKAPIIAMTDEVHKATTLSLFYGVFPVLNEQELQLKYRQLGINEGDNILIARRGLIQFIKF